MPQKHVSADSVPSAPALPPAGEASETIAPPAPPPPEARPPAEWAKQKGVPAWQLAGAACGEAWPTDHVLSEPQFDDAIRRALSAQAG